MKSAIQRLLPIGAEIVRGRASRAGGQGGQGGGQADGVHFRVWAPKRQRVEVVIGESAHALKREPSGYHSGLVADAGDSTRYKLRLDGGDSFPDPASRFQPDGPHGPSLVVDPLSFRWTDGTWKGRRPERQVLYEMHIGTFTRDGTFAAAAEQLPELAGLGITALEVMPLAEFSGRFGWGYDGVDLFAPYHVYGTPDDFRAFVNRAHVEGLCVILDVVYNHFGPDGNYLRQFSDAYFSAKHATDWGDAINYDGPDSAPVREFALSNVRHWIAEYHLDGLRLDATDNIYDDSDPHLITQIALAARDAAHGRGLIMLAENEAQSSRLLRSREKGGFGLDMVWNDDFHHSATVAATGRREAYFTDYRGAPQEFVSAAKYGYLYQGQRYAWQKKRRGRAAWDVPAHRFVHFLQNHDQIANSRDGRRLHQLASPARYRALTTLMLLGPQTPMLFQGEEFGASTPFLYFADHKPALAKLVRKGRREFLKQFPSLVDVTDLADPCAIDSFERSCLDFSERQSNAEQYTLHRDLIALRQCDPVLASRSTRVDGAVLGISSFVLRFFGDDGNDRLLVINLGVEAALDIAPEPLLAPNDRQQGWTRLWYSEDPCYGGRGAWSPEITNGGWRIPAESATLLASDGGSV